MYHMYKYMHFLNAKQLSKNSSSSTSALYLYFLCPPRINHLTCSLSTHWNFRIPVQIAHTWARLVLEEAESAAVLAQVGSDWSRHWDRTFHCRSGGGRLGWESCWVSLKVGRWWLLRLDCVTECHLLAAAGGSVPRPRGTRPAHWGGHSRTQIWGFWWEFSPLMALLLFLPIVITLVGGMI